MRRRSTKKLTTRRDGMLPGEPPAEVAALNMTLNSLLNHYKLRFGEEALRNLICAVLDGQHRDRCEWCSRSFD